MTPTSRSSGSGFIRSGGSPASPRSRWAPPPPALAMKDANVEWRDVQFAFGGSYEVDNPDSVVNQLGMTGIPFFNMYNGCATAASVLTQASNTIRLGEYDIGMAIGMDKHVPGAFDADPTPLQPAQLVRRGRHVPHAEVLRREDPALHARLRHHPDDAGAGGGEELRQRRLNENAFRRTPMSVEAILESRIVNDPLTQYMFCAPDEGAAAIVLCRADRAHQFTDTPIYLRASEMRTRRIGAFEVHIPVDPDRAGARRRRSTRRAPRTRGPASAPRTST